MSRVSIKIFIDKFRQIIYNKLWTSYGNGRRLNPAPRNGGFAMHKLFEIIACAGSLSAIGSFILSVYEIFFRDTEHYSKKK